MEVYLAMIRAAPRQAMTVGYGLLIGKNESDPISDMDRATGSVMNAAIVAVDPAKEEIYAHSESEPNLPRRRISQGVPSDLASLESEPSKEVLGKEAAQKIFKEPVHSRNLKSIKSL